MADELPWLTLTEAARFTGVNRETLRSRVRRGLIPSRRSNSGAMLVQVDRDATGEPTEGDQGITAPDQGMTEAVTELQDEIADLRERLTRVEAERDAARAIAAAERAAKEELVAELKAMLADTRRPWWRRLLGA